MYEANLATARSVQRDRDRYWLIQYLKQEKIKFFDGVVVKAQDKKNLVYIEFLAGTYFFRPIRDWFPKPGDNVNLSIKGFDEKRGKILLSGRQVD